MRPFRISITAIEASNKLNILDKAFEPAVPRNFINIADSRNTRPQNRILLRMEIIAAKRPYSETISMDVVSTAGPAMSGVPSGTAPSSAEGTRLFLTGLTISIIARQKRTAPPAIIKSPIAMPSSLNTSFPTRTKPTVRPTAVIID